MALPSFATVPPSETRASLPPAEWQACMASWIKLVELHLRQNDSDWNKSMEEDRTNVIGFLRSYFQALAKPVSQSELTTGQTAARLRRLCFLLFHRTMSMNTLSEDLFTLEVLSGVCIVFPRSKELRKLLTYAWKRRPQGVDGIFQTEKIAQIKALDAGQLSNVQSMFTRAIPVLYQVPDVAAFLMTGSDLLDSIAAAYREADDNFRRIAIIYVYFGFLGLLASSEPNITALSDHLYSLKSSAHPGQASLLSDVVSNTPLIHKIRQIVLPQDPARAQKLENVIRSHRQAPNALLKRGLRKKIEKGKGHSVGNLDHGMASGAHVHRMSLITQVQELFPELGSGFIVKLLDEYDDNVEQVTMHLLDESLPAHLSGLDRTMELQGKFKSDSIELATQLVPRPTPPPERRNIYDNDELDQLAVDTSRIHFGRSKNDHTADTVLADGSSKSNKAAILSALAAFDSDDDERDDTYDIEDVGGTVDTSMSNEEANVDKNEEVLFAAYRTSPETFNRDAATRRGKARMALKAETGLTDEAIEGWAIILARQPRKLRMLEARYSTFTGQQDTIERTAWRDSGGGEEEESSGGERGRGRGRDRGGRGGRGGKGGRGGRGGRGGNVSGPSNDASTQQARQRKEANKGSRANHNRRDQRARKMARGGLAG
ncbi:uncharacterized protein PV09_05884 [Verruconis gallopava]|uniref:CUE domain-containing protein n=1 Tax=Verruconis gallopava TaxID=253628 RepID=A0A0D1YQD1_9PEZI|nr:uncharacterized protein PV09_05884 [Verruconis gallopava]KIW02827.1 hypothetical protein PV09_05884 [Verruconis gallopava]